MYGRSKRTEADNMHRRNLIVHGMHVLNRRVLKDAGTHWGLSRGDYQRDAIALIQKDQPDWEVAGPPCTAFCGHNYGLNVPRMDLVEVERRIAEGVTHLRSARKLYT